MEMVVRDIQNRTTAHSVGTGGTYTTCVFRTRYRRRLPPCPVAQAITVHDKQRAQRVWLSEEYAAAAIGCSSTWCRPNMRLHSMAEDTVHPAMTVSWKEKRTHTSVRPESEWTSPRNPALTVFILILHSVLNNSQPMDMPTKYGPSLVHGLS